MMEDTCATTANEKALMQNTKQTYVQPINAIQSVNNHEGTSSQPAITRTNVATTTPSVHNDIVQGDNNNNKVDNKNVRCTDDAEQSK